MKKTTWIFVFVFTFMLSIPNLYATDDGIFDSVDNSFNESTVIQNEEITDDQGVTEENKENLTEVENKEEEEKEEEKKNIKEEIKEDIKEIKSDVKSWWENFKEAFKENVVEPAKSLWEKIVEGVKEIGNAIKGIFTGNKTEAAANTDDASSKKQDDNNTGKGGLAGAIEGIANDIKGLINDIKQDVNGTTNEAKKDANKAATSINGAFSDITNGIIDVVNSVKDGVESVKSAITGKETKTIRACETTEINIPSGADNFCGQFAMTALLRALGKNVSEEEIYNATNPSGIFTGPSAIVEYLNKKGVSASSKNNASLDDLVAQIDKGYPVMCLVNTKFDDGGNGKATGAHWVCIYGYEKDKDGNVVSLKMRDAFWNINENKNGWKKDPLPVDEFLKIWGSPLGETRLSNFGFLTSCSSYKNLMIAVDGTKEESSGSMFNVNLRTATEDNAAGAINDLVTGWKNKDYVQVGSGVVKSIFGIPSVIVGGASNAISSGSDNLINWGNGRMEQGGMFNEILGGAAYGIGSVGKAVGTVGKTASNIVAGVGSAIGDGAKSLWNGAKNLWNSIF